MKGGCGWGCVWVIGVVFVSGWLWLFVGLLVGSVVGCWWGCGGLVVGVVVLDWYWIGVYFCVRFVCVCVDFYLVWWSVSGSGSLLVWRVRCGIVCWIFMLVCGCGYWWWLLVVCRCVVFFRVCWWFLWWCILVWCCWWCSSSRSWLDWICGCYSVGVWVGGLVWLVCGWVFWLFVCVWFWLVVWLGCWGSCCGGIWLGCGGLLIIVSGYGIFGLVYLDLVVVVLLGSWMCGFVVGGGDVVCGCGRLCWCLCWYCFG